MTLDHETRDQHPLGALSILDKEAPVVHAWLRHLTFDQEKRDRHSPGALQCGSLTLGLLAGLVKASGRSPE
jgi:hypothetical protein